MKYPEIKAEKTKRLDILMKECKIFFAFNDEQFNEGKSEMVEGDKIVSVGAGGYMPKSAVNLWLEGIKTINQWYTKEIKKSKQQSAEILYELNNHEAFYTYDLDDTCSALEGRYSKAEIKKVFDANVNNN